MLTPSFMPWIEKCSVGQERKLMDKGMQGQGWSALLADSSFTPDQGAHTAQDWFCGLERWGALGAELRVRDKEEEQLSSECLNCATSG